MLGLLLRILENGVEGTAWSFGFAHLLLNEDLGLAEVTRRVEVHGWGAEVVGYNGLDVQGRKRPVVRLLPPSRLTARQIAQILIAELLSEEYEAEEFDPDRPRELHSVELARFVETERRVKEERAMMRRAMGLPLGGKAQGDVDGYLRWQSGKLKLGKAGGIDLDDNTPAAKAAALRNELGKRFINGDWPTRERIVRDLLRNYREQGRLPKGRGFVIRSPRGE